MTTPNPTGGAAPEVRPPDPGPPAAIGTAEVRTDPSTNPRTGELRRPWPVLVATPLIYVGVAGVVAGLLTTFWRSIEDFAGASWLHGLFTTGPGDLLRVALVAAEFGLVMAIGTLALIAGYYAWWGYAWTRWWSIMAAVVALSAWIINPTAGIGACVIVIGCALLRVPAVTAFNARHAARRYPAAPAADIRDDVYYGPLPRYRA
ncbi:MAG: hypothetical protein ACK5LS_02080 [Propioniciclava sp.]